MADTKDNMNNDTGVNVKRSDDADANVIEDDSIRSGTDADTDAAANTGENAGTVNRTYQDTVFRRLFNSRDKLIELYNALENTSLGPDTPVEITTLEDALYIDRKNDLGFIIDNHYIILAEHQSTINCNMPYRLLSYAARTLERHARHANLYGRKQQEIPAPEFFVFYTGEAPWDADMLRLSDSYAAPPRKNSMELVVKVINLSYNEENEILKRNKDLWGYSRLLYYIRQDMKRGRGQSEAVAAAIERCLNEDCLTEFLRKYGGEVEMMLFQEISIEEFAELRAEESFEDGLAQGMQQGVQKGFAQGGIHTLIQDNLEEGISCERIVEKLMKRFSLDKEDAENRLREELAKQECNRK